MLIARFTEVESGRRSDRPELVNALAAARLHRLPIIVAKVDRLTRSVAFLSRLLEAGVDVRFADLPQIEGPTGRFMLQQMASVAEIEAGLAAAKARGVKIGGNRGAIISTEARATGRAVQAARSKARAADLAPILAELKNADVTTLAGIARALSDRRIPTARGVSGWTPTQVSRVLARTEA